MIEGRLDKHGLVLSAALPAGCVSYIDRDWVGAVDAPIPSLSFTGGGHVLWCGQEQLGHFAAGTDPTAVAAGALLAVAREATAAALDGVRGAVDVVGQGLIAAHVRRLVAHDGRHTGKSPSSVVDTTGDPEIIRAALGRVSDLGTIVLAGEPAGRMLDVDLYSSVHTRGLVLAGVAPPLHGVDIAAVTEVDDADLAFCRDVLVDASPEQPLPGDALWYRIAA